MNFKEAIAVQQSFGLQKNSEFRRLFNHQLLKARNTGVAKQVGISVLCTWQNKNRLQIV